MKTQLRNLKLEFPDLQGAVCDVWSKIPSKLVSNLYESMPKRIHSEFRTQAARKNTDIMVVSVFSVRFIAYEFTLDERRLLIRQ